MENLKVACEYGMVIRVLEGEFIGMELFLDEEYVDGEWKDVLKDIDGEVRFIVVNKEALTLEVGISELSSYVEITVKAV